MSLARRIAGGGERARVNTIPASQMPLALALLGQKGFTGRRITVETALKLDIVLACIRLLSETIGAMPLRTFRRDAGGNKVAILTHPTTRLLNRPNPEMPRETFWGLVMTHLASWGEAFLGKEILGDRVIALWPIEPDRVEVKRVNGVKEFWVTPADGVGEPKRYTQADVIHIIGFTLDGLRGVSVIGLMREAVSSGLAIDEYVGRFFGNQGMPPMVLQTDEELDDEARGRLVRDWKRKYGGLTNVGKVPVLEKGLKIQEITLPWKDLEFIGLQQLSSRKIARAFRVPASMVDAEEGQGKGLQYRTLEGDNMNLITHTARPWLGRIAGSLMLDFDLFPAASPMECEHVYDDLLMLDAKTKAEVRQIETGGKAWKKPSEIRAEDGLPPDQELDELAVAPPTPPAPAEPPAKPAEPPARDAPIVIPVVMQQPAQRNQPVDLTPVGDALARMTEALQANAEKPLPPVHLHVDKGAIPIELSARFAVELAEAVQRGDQEIELPDGRRMRLRSVSAD